MTQKNPANLLRAYLIVGSDELKRTAALTKLRSYIPDDCADFSLDEFQADELTEPDQLISSLQTFAFMFDIRMVIVHNIGALQKPIAEALVTYLKDPNPTTVLCCEGETLAKNTALYKALAKVGPKSVVECGTLKTWELPPQIVKIGANLGLSVQNDAAKELVNRLGENTVAIENQLKTFAEIHGAGATITKKLVCDEVAQIAEIKPWTFADTLCERNVAEALRLAKLMGESDYVFLLIVITRRLQELICAKALDARGASSMLASELGVQQWQVKNHARWARNFTMNELTGLLDAAQTCEAALKGSPDSQTAFTSFMVQFAKH